MNKEALIAPAILQKCSCDDKDCPNQILWINKQNLIDYGDGNEVMGCIPIASFQPEELHFLDPLFWKEMRTLRKKFNQEEL